MTRPRTLAGIVFVVAVATGTILDSRARAGRAAGSGSILAADLHVHPYPGDGGLPTWELQREAMRRGLDVVAVTGHNNRFGLDLGGAVPLQTEWPILLAGQEITTPSFHLIAVGIERLIDWRLTAREAIDAIHAQGGAAIAAHPAPDSWRVDDETALRALDGAEVAHPSVLSFSPTRAAFEAFSRRVQAVNPSLSPIGSSDFHMTAPLGLCRTYLLVDERSAAGAVAAIRLGRTVARDPHGRFYGTPAHVAAVKDWLATASPSEEVGRSERLTALVALASLVFLAVPPLGLPRRDTANWR